MIRSILRRNAQILIIFFARRSYNIIGDVRSRDYCTPPPLKSTGMSISCGRPSGGVPHAHGDDNNYNKRVPLVHVAKSLKKKHDNTTRIVTAAVIVIIIIHTILFRTRRVCDSNREKDEIIIKIFAENRSPRQ